MLREGTRVLIKGEAVGQMFRQQLGDGYKIMLSQVGCAWHHPHTQM